MEKVEFIIIAVTAVISLIGFANNDFFNNYSFRVFEIIKGKEFYRLVSSGFLHGSVMHLFFNMLVLYLFSDALIAIVGVPHYFMIYAISLIFGNLLALFIHRNHHEYSAIGASGAVSGIVFATIVYAPGAKLGFLFLPISMPGWIFGIIYILGTIYGIKLQSDNIGHEAHLGGAIAGILLACSIIPKVIFINYLVIMLFLIPIIVFLILIVKNPGFLFVDNIWKYESKKIVKKIKQKTNITEKRENINREQKIVAEKRNDEIKLNKLLDKINAQGYKNLSSEEISELERFSKKL